MVERPEKAHTLIKIGLRFLGAGAHFPVECAEAREQLCSLGPLG